LAKLIVLDGSDSGSEHDLDVLAQEGRTSFTAGRDPLAEIPINDTAVSRRHFTLERASSRWRLVDQGSRNQTFLNGKPVKDAILADGDSIRVGDTELRFESPGEAVDSCGVASTIIKELPTARVRDTILDRIASLEEALEAGKDPSSREDARQAAARLAKLLEVYGEIAATGSAADLFSRLLSETLGSLDADLGSIVLREGNRWVLKASQARDGAGKAPKVSETILERAASERKAVLSAATRESGLGSEPGKGAASVVAAPIVVALDARGVLYAERRAGRRPFTEEDLEALAALAEPAGRILEKVEAEERLRQENRNLFRSITETKRIIGRSKQTEEVLDFIRRAAPTPMTVLVLGETGTGKELVASAIHYASPRRGRPFVAINCAALPENLVESELFGHERGAFTGAVTRRKGRFELADTGTVFLDEVGELSLACQAKLLRLLEERQFERVGGVESVKVDVRIIAATNRDLLTAVHEGKFREDLYYRLSVLNVRLAPLRERVEDIPLLAQHFLDACGSPKKVSKSAEKKLATYAWPGNVRQLRNAIESAIVLGEGREIRAEDLVLPPPGAGSAKAREAWEPITLEELERLHIERVLAHTSGNKKRAAEMLGIERCTLYSKLKAYGYTTAKEENDD